MNNAYIDAYTCISSETYLYMYKWMKIAFSWRQSEHHRLKKKKKCIYVCNHHCYSHFFKITSTHDINFLETDSKFSVIYVFEFVSKNKFYISTNDKRNWTKPRFSSSFFFLWRKRRKLEAEAKRNFKEENVSIDSDRSIIERVFPLGAEPDAIGDGLATIGTRGKEFLGNRPPRIPVENCSNVRSIGYAIFNRRWSNLSLEKDVLDRFFFSNKWE